MTCCPHCGSSLPANIVDLDAPVSEISCAPGSVTTTGGIDTIIATVTDAALEMWRIEHGLPPALPVDPDPPHVVEGSP